MAKRNRGTAAAGIIAGAVGVTALAALGTCAAALMKWAKDPNATVLWLGGLPGGKGVRIVKGEEAHSYQVQTGYRWHDDDEAAAEMNEAAEPEIEIPLPEEPETVSVSEEPVGEVPADEKNCCEEPGSAAPECEAPDAGE